MFWEVQKHPYKKAFTHVDFYGVDLDKEVKVDVPIEFVGVSRGVKLGGVMETYRERAPVLQAPGHAQKGDHRRDRYGYQ